MRGHVRECRRRFVANDHPQTSILFSDICGFTTLASMLSTCEVVELLNDLFTAFDEIVDQYMVHPPPSPRTTPPTVMDGTSEDCLSVERIPWGGGYYGELQELKERRAL